MPRVSFVVICHNFESYVGECIASILQQRATDDFEIVVVDDASTDGSADVIRSFGDPRIRFVRHDTNHGAAASIEEGLRLAGGDYVARIDGDDRYRTNYLHRVLPILEKHPDVGMVYGDVALINSRGDVLENPWLGVRSRAAHGERDFKGDEFLALVIDNWIPAPTIIMRREALDAALPFPPRLFFTDWYLNLRVAQRFALYYVADTLADYRFHDTNRHAQIQAKRAYLDTVIRILDSVFAEPDRQREKRHVRDVAYALAYVRYADACFGSGAMAEARWSYLKALKHRPIHSLRPSVVLHLLGTFVGAPRYSAAKALLRRVRAP